MISTKGWDKYSIWEHSSTVNKLYSERCRKKTEEMTCAAQAADLFAISFSDKDTLLDVGCGSGYFFHSLISRHISMEYWGLDASKTLIEIGKSILPNFGLPKERLIHGRIEDLDAKVDHILCMNVLSNIDNYHRPLERLLLSTNKTLIIRESVADIANYSYVEDKYLDIGFNLKVHVNTYPRREFVEFIQSYGFEVEEIVDLRTQGKPELIIDYPHHWKFFRAVRI